MPAAEPKAAQTSPNESIPTAAQTADVLPAIDIEAQHLRVPCVGDPQMAFRIEHDAGGTAKTGQNAVGLCKARRQNLRLGR